MKGKLTLLALAIVALVLYSCNQNTPEQAKEGMAASAPAPEGDQNANSYDSEGKFDYIITYDEESSSYFMMKYDMTTLAIDSPNPKMAAQKIPLPTKATSPIKFFNDGGTPKISASSLPEQANYVVNKHTFANISSITTAGGFVTGTDVRGNAINEPASNLVYIGKDAGSGGIVLGFAEQQESD